MSAKQAHDLPLIQGLRPRKARGYPWQQVILSRLSWDFQRLRPSASTKAAELGLGYRLSAYWFVLRSEAAFGRIAIIWRMNDQPGSSGQVLAEGAAMPCDTGGLWHGHIEAEPPFSNGKDKRVFARGEERTVGQFPVDFGRWLRDGYPEDSSRYVDGDIPLKHVPRIVLGETRNSSRAWTWELRIDADKANQDIVEPLEIFWTEADFEEFEAWTVEYPDLSHSDRAKLIAGALQISTFTDHPIQTLRDRLYELAP